MTLPPRPVFNKSDVGALDTDEEKPKFNYTSGFMVYVIMLVIAAIASFGVNYGMGLSNNAKLVTMQSSLDGMQSDLRASKDSIKLALDTLPDKIDAATQGKLDSIDARLNEIDADVKAALDNSLTATNESSSALNKVEMDKINIVNLAGQIEALQKEIKELREAK